MSHEVSAPAEVYAWIAVRRHLSPNATVPEWEPNARVIPAGEYDAADREYMLSRGFELVPLTVDADDRTRPAPPQ
ncbi:hypothetical protein A5789_27565 [Nocardia sp. 852002-51101_SCH5132738]|uniref:hypothetical protein n=1 Tax=Nocardia sp. 852002-51101_SCH5132738 TaxID=1834095 RepID=UPI0007E9577E|nr:hypothetical protein [Nocardia sp. 852002-51101_SCH5132738]OBA51535.1 hypothetical protein A5789_27565 [Nocardia sp. 852002-51101_SCH5132738]